MSLHEPAPLHLDDADPFSLRRFLGDLGTELQVVDAPTALSTIADALEGNSRAVLFRQAGAERAELVGNVAASRARIARAFGVAPNALRQEVLRRLALPPRIDEIASADAPVHEVVLTGETADLTRLPVHLQHEYDGAPYISAALDYTVDTKTGWTNTGFRRLMLRGRREAGVDVVSPSDLRAIYLAAVARGETLPVTFVIGCHPTDQVAATMRLPVDELGLVASLRGGSLSVVKGITNDIRVPADAEYTLEGYLDARGHVEPEGPFGEFLGYYGELKHNPVFHLTAITHRRNPLFQTSTIGGRTMSCTDTAQLCALRTEVMVWRALQGAVREPLDVCASAGSGGMLNVRIALRQRVPGEARNAIAAAFGSLANVKNVFVVDPDIDIFSDEQVDWALATRFQAHRDMVVMSGLRTLPLDPSLDGGVTGSKAGFDLTLPFSSEPRRNLVPEPPKFAGARFESLQSALATGPKYFAELMAAMASDDGREIVRALDALRAHGLGRDEAGRYVMAPHHA